MTLIHRIDVTWSGWSGAPGISTYYALDAATLLPPLRTFLANFITILPSGITLTFPTSGAQLEDTTGVVSGAWTASAPAQVVGTASGNYSGRTGLVVGWSTSVVVGRRLLRGRNFYVPISVNAYSPDGTLADGTVAAIQTAADAFIAGAGEQRIWHRPNNLPLNNGVSHPVASAKVRDRVQVLTSRAQ